MRTQLLTFFMCAFFLPITTHAQNYSVSLKTGTLGIGIEGMRTFGPGYAARIGFNNLSYSYSGFDGGDYIMDTDITLSSITLFTDWFPFNRGYHITCGFIYNINEAEATLTPSQSYDVGGRIYTPEMLGNLKAKIRFNRIAPYIGIGHHEGTVTGWWFTFDAGVYYHGPPSVDLTASGLLKPSTEQEPIIEDNIKWFSFYPVISLGVIYTF